MLDYIKSILPRLKQYSKELNDTANFADIPWGFKDDDGDVVTYLFRRNGELLVSKKGDVVTGRWEYLAMIESLLIEYDGKKRLYNQGFLDGVVMVLRKDDTDDLFGLANKRLISDLNISSHLKRKMEALERKEAIERAKKVQPLASQRQDEPGTPKSKPPEGPKYSELRINGIKEKVLVIYNSEHQTYVNGPALYSSTKNPLPDGEYKTPGGLNMTVKDGIVVKEEVADIGAAIVFILILFILIIILTR